MLAPNAPNFSDANFIFATSAQTTVYTAAMTRTIPRIKYVRAYVQSTSGANVANKQGSDCHDVPLDHWINGISPAPIANPMSVHPKYAGARTSWGINALGSCVVEVEAEDGTTGVPSEVLALYPLASRQVPLDCHEIDSSHSWIQPAPRPL